MYEGQAIRQIINAEFLSDGSFLAVQYRNLAHLFPVTISFDSESDWRWTDLQAPTEKNIEIKQNKKALEVRIKIPHKMNTTQLFSKYYSSTFNEVTAFFWFVQQPEMN